MGTPKTQFTKGKSNNSHSTVLSWGLTGFTLLGRFTGGSFYYAFSIKKNNLSIQSTGKSYDLIINSQFFSHLYGVTKNKREFQGADGDFRENDEERKKEALLVSESEKKKQNEEKRFTGDIYFNKAVTKEGQNKYQGSDPFGQYNTKKPTTSFETGTSGLATKTAPVKNSRFDSKWGIQRSRRGLGLK